MTSALLHNGPDHLRSVELGLRDWMDRHRYETIDQLRGQLSQRSVPDPAAFERANYIKTLASRTPPAAECRSASMGPGQRRSREVLRVAPLIGTELSA
jgi:dihydroorotate dehydrogenase (fumarate)